MVANPLQHPDPRDVPDARAPLRFGIARRLALKAGFTLHGLWSRMRRKLTNRILDPSGTGTRMLLTPSLPSRTIWMYWDKGWDAAPPLARLSVATWRRHNPGWTIRFLDRDTASALTGIPPEVLRIDMLPAHLADIIRLELLTQFGGVWADVTTLCERPLDDWLPALMPFGFFAFAVPEQRTVSNWFIAAAPGNRIVRAWRDMAYRYWSTSDKPTTYMLYYDLFELAMAADRAARRDWRFSPKVDRLAANALRYTYLDRALTAQFAEYCRAGMFPLHKFSFREEIPDDFSGTPLAVALGLDTRAALESATAAMTLEDMVSS